MRKRFAIFSIITLLAVGCGYSTHSVLPASYKTIHVLPFKNKVSYSTTQSYNSYVPLLEVKVHNSIVDRYLFDGNLKISEEEDANLVLKGELVSFERNVLREDVNNNVQEYRIHVIIAMTLWDTENKEVIWSEPSFAGEATYFLTGPQTISESAAVDEAVADLARRVVERTIEDW